MSARSNVVKIARREYEVRVRTRSFLWGTLLLVIGVTVIALLPVIVGQIDKIDATKVAVGGSSAELVDGTATTLRTMLNATADPAGNPGSTSSPAKEPDYVVSTVGDVDTGRTAVTAGTYAALLGVERSASGELEFTLYTNENAAGRTASLVRQAATTIAIADRLERLGVKPADQASLFAPAGFKVTWSDPARTEPIKGTMATVGQDMLAFGMTILIFMMIIMYGNWVAMSVVEEKSSRVMEVVLNAATPFEVLAGKVFGVGAVALTQYVAVAVSGGLALLLQGAIASAVLGKEGAAVELPQGLTPELLVMFGLYGVLGFLLYATLYAAAGSLLSRQEDVNSAVMPMTLLSTGSYMIGVYAAMGLLDIKAGWIAVLTQIPFLSPFMMLGRISTGVAQPAEVILSIVLLVAAITLALWLAARVYAAGVLLYGQRPGFRSVFRLVREGM